MGICQFLTACPKCGNLVQFQAHWDFVLEYRLYCKCGHKWIKRV